MDESSLESSERNHVNTLDEAPSQINEDLFDATPADVVEDTRNTDTNTRDRVAVLFRMIFESRHVLFWIAVIEFRV